MPPKISENTEAQTSFENQQSPTAAEIQSWLVLYIEELLEIEEVDITTPFDRYGLDSAAVAGMIGDMETWLGRKLDPALPYDFPNIKALAQHLAT